MEGSVKICLAVSVLAIIIAIWDYKTRKAFDGTLYILAVTLITIVWYTYFTYKIAHKKEEPSIAASIQYGPQSRSINVIVSNLTNQYAETRLWVEVKVNGRVKKNIKDYCGDTPWHLTPRFTIAGVLFMENHLKELVGKSFDEMIREANNTITRDQYRFSLKVTWKDKDGNGYETPTHHWYFDFRQNNFVYQVGGFD